LILQGASRVTEGPTVHHIVFTELAHADGQRLAANLTSVASQEGKCFVLAMSNP
jgi:hypothetical protein